MSAAHELHPTTPCSNTLYLAFDLGWTSWNLAFTTAMAQKPRLRTIPARDLDALRREILLAKQRFALPGDATVLSCYEAGRDGFWLHRYLAHHAITNLVVDAASIEVNRRARRAKSDRLDVGKLLTMLIRYHGGERKLWSVVRIPAADDEDRRQPHRELIAVKGQRTEHSNRIKGLLANLGLDVEVDEQLPERLGQLRQWDGAPVPTELTARILGYRPDWRVSRS
jgi:transposase